jgi:uncharacterized protein (TIGR00269 family)
VIDVRRHNANYCPEHFLRMCRDQTSRAIADFGMIAPGERVLVAVSGGKDSLALWDLLVGLGYAADGLYLGLGLGEYSDASGGFVRAFAAERGLTLQEIDLRADLGFDVPTAAAVTKRVPCSACGLSKRHLFDQAARDGAYDVVVTGHNLDDEAAVLFGNTVRWQEEYLARQLPVLPGGGGFPRKAKPLVRLGERETAAYCVLAGIDYQVEECPMAAGNRHLGYKDILNRMEEQSPGAKHEFYFGFLARAWPRFADAATGVAQPGGGGRCARCGAPTTAEVCAFCRLRERASAAEPVPLRLGSKRRRAAVAEPGGTGEHSGAAAGTP